jgi:SAM-dependent methyltransferase
MNTKTSTIRIAARKILREGVRRIFPKSVRIEGSIIPSRTTTIAGPKFKNYKLYLESAENEAKRLVKHFQCNINSRVLDVGCGLGRLPIGILRIIGEIDYTGIDVDKISINWCNRFIGKYHPTFKFRHLSVYNERYNEKGTKIDKDFRFDFADSSVDIIYLFSVFSHTTEEDMRIYLKEFDRILRGNGFIFFTTFVEENVPDITFNPENYSIKCSGPLHIVRYNKEYIFSIIKEYGFTVASFMQSVEVDGQSGLYLQKRTK